MNAAELATRLQELINAEPDLRAALERTHDADQAIDLIQAAAARQGMALDGGELKNALQGAHAQTTVGELTEEQLAGVDGGGPAADIVNFFVRLFGGKVKS